MKRAENDYTQLRYNVSQLLREPSGSARRYEIDMKALDLGEGLVIHNLRGNVKFMRTGPGILVTGLLKGDVELDCVRCLETYRTSIDMELEEEYIQTVQVTTGMEVDLSEEEEDSEFFIDAEHTLDLTAAIRQEALLAMPMQPVCREECAGLCQRCGANLNQGQCECEPEVEDTPWFKLNELLKIDEDSERSER